MKIFKNREDHLSQKMLELNMWLLFNHTKAKYLLTGDKYKSTSGQLQNRGQLQNNPVNGDYLDYN